MNVRLAAFLSGALFCAALVAMLFFLKFWRRTGDRLFLAFAATFLAEAFYRLHFLFTDHPNEADTDVYLFRLAGYLIILAAILGKNRGKR